MGHNGEDDRLIGTGIPRTILSLIVIMCGIVFCTVSLIMSMDIACNVSIDRWLPLYPGAEEVSVQYDFVRPRGMGSTLIIFRTADHVDTVRQWYADFQRKMIREGVHKATEQGMARTTFRITENPDGAGTLIYHASECAST